MRGDQRNRLIAVEWRTRVSLPSISSSPRWIVVASRRWVRAGIRNDRVEQSGATVAEGARRFIGAGLGRGPRIAVTSSEPPCVCASYRPMHRIPRATLRVTSKRMSEKPSPLNCADKPVIGPRIVRHADSAAWPCRPWCRSGCPSCGMKKLFMTLAEVSRKCTGAPTGTIRWLTVASPAPG